MEGNLAESTDDGQETITVDMDAADPSKAVSRIKPVPRRPATVDAEWAAKSNEKSKDVKKRLNRIERSFNQQLAEQEARFQREISDRDARIARLEARREESGTPDEAAHAKVMDALQEKIEEAQDKGDSKEVAKLTREMSTLEAKFWATKTAKQTGTTNGEAARRELTPAEKEAADRKAAAAKNGNPTGPTDAGKKWSKANAEWWNDTIDPVSKHARALANQLYKQKVDEGDDPEDVSFYEDIGKEVAKRFPEIEIKGLGRPHDLGEDDDEFEPDRRQRQEVRRLPSQSLPDRGTNTRRNSQTLTREDIATMRSVQMDPDNNKHVIQFLKSKQETEADNA